MLKRYDIDSYKDFISKYVVDGGIKNEIIKQIDRFSKEGLIIICGREFCGKIRNITGEDYLDIKYIDDCLICNYTKHNLRKRISIVQSKVNDNIRVNRKEELECTSLDGYNENIEQQKIYFGNKLIYESLINNNQDYYLKPNMMIYNNRSFVFNRFSLMKKWYFENKSIVLYKMNKDFFEHDKLKESHSICIEPYIKNYNMVYDYEILDVEIFNKLMLGQMSIEEVVELISNQKVKKLNGGV